MEGIECDRYTGLRSIQATPNRRSLATSDRTFQTDPLLDESNNTSRDRSISLSAGQLRLDPIAFCDSLL
jgi:hypothetical protein